MLVEGQEYLRELVFWIALVMISFSIAVIIYRVSKHTRYMLSKSFREVNEDKILGKLYALHNRQQEIITELNYLIQAKDTIHNDFRDPASKYYGWNIERIISHIERFGQEVNEIGEEIQRLEEESRGYYKQISK